MGGAEGRERNRSMTRDVGASAWTINITGFKLNMADREFEEFRRSFEKLPSYIKAPTPFYS